MFKTHLGCNACAAECLDGCKISGAAAKRRRQAGGEPSCRVRADSALRVERLAVPAALCQCLWPGRKPRASGSDRRVTQTFLEKPLVIRLSTTHWFTSSLVHWSMIMAAACSRVNYPCLSGPDRLGCQCELMIGADGKAVCRACIPWCSCGASGFHITSWQKQLLLSPPNLTILVYISAHCS